MGEGKGKERETENSLIVARKRFIWAMLAILRFIIGCNTRVTNDSVNIHEWLVQLRAP